MRQPNVLRCIRGGAFQNLAAEKDLTNADIMAMTPEAERDARFAFSWAIASGAVGVAYRLYHSKEGKDMHVPALLLPFSDEKPDGTRSLCLHTNWRPQFSDWIQGNVTADLHVAPKKSLIRYRETATQSADAPA